LSDSRLRQAFVQALGIAGDTAVEDLRYRGLEAWDSVAHMQLVSAIEEAFDVMLETRDVIDMSSYAKAREILGKYGVNF
jgi:acyl carrier protein